MFLLPLPCLTCYHLQCSLLLKTLLTALWINSNSLLWTILSVGGHLLSSLTLSYCSSTSLLLHCFSFWSWTGYAYSYIISFPLSVPSVWNPLPWNLCKPDFILSFKSQSHVTFSKCLCKKPYPPPSLRSTLSDYSISSSLEYFQVYGNIPFIVYFFIV